MSPVEQARNVKVTFGGGDEGASWRPNRGGLQTLDNVDPSTVERSIMTHLGRASAVTGALSMLALAMTLLGPPASADARLSAQDETVETQVHQLDPETCREVREQDPDNSCQVETQLVLGPVESQPSVTGEVLTNESVALAASPSCRSWTMKRRPRDGSMPWQISQRGRHCWDGQYAWYGSYRGVSGYHECGYDDYGIFSVKERSCTRSGNKSSKIRNTYSVTFEIPKTTIYATFTLTYEGTRSGAYTYYGL